MSEERGGRKDGQLVEFARAILHRKSFEIETPGKLDHVCIHCGARIDFVEACNGKGIEHGDACIVDQAREVVREDDQATPQTMVIDEAVGEIAALAIEGGEPLRLFGFEFHGDAARGVEQAQRESGARFGDSFPLTMLRPGEESKVVACRLVAREEGPLSPGGLKIQALITDRAEP